MRLKPSTNSRLLTTTMIPFAVGIGLFAYGCTDTTAQTAGERQYAAADNPCAAADGNPCAAKSCNPCAAAGGNPCAAKACSPCGAAGCNPCAANPCNPCAASPCNPCNPCAAGGAKTECLVPRLSEAGCNPCAAKSACNPCNPCAAKAANPCNPCAAKADNPCAAKSCNPCAAANPCNPCAANPCNPCAAGGSAELTDAEAATAYECAVQPMRAAYAKSGYDAADGYTEWPRFNTVPYPSATHGGRLVNNYASPMGAEGYARYEDVGEMPAGSVLAKDSFTVDGKGRVAVGPLFLMTKMDSGWNAETGDWKYAMIMPDGSLFGETGGKNSGGVQFCADCHNAVEGQDYLFFMPEDVRR